MHTFELFLIYSIEALHADNSTEYTCAVGASERDHTPSATEASAMQFQGVSLGISSWRSSPLLLRPKENLTHSFTLLLPTLLPPPPLFFFSCACSAFPGTPDDPPD